MADPNSTTNPDRPDIDALVDRMHEVSVRVGEQLVAFADTEDASALSVLGGLCALLVGHFLYHKSAAAQAQFIDGFNSMLDGSHVRYRLIPPSTH